MHRQHRVVRCAELTLDLLGRLGEVDHLDVEARGHQAARRTVGEAHDARDHRLFLGLEHALALGLGDDRLDLFVGDAILAGPCAAEQRQHQAARLVEQPHQRRGDRRDHRHAGRRAGRNPFGIPQRQLLGHELAEDQREIGNRKDHDADPDGAGGRIRDAALQQEFTQPVAEGGARKGARQHADQADADLCRRQEFARVLGQLQRHCRALVAIGGHDFQPRRAGRNNGEFRHGKQPVQEDQNDDDDDFDVHELMLTANRHRHKGSWSTASRAGWACRACRRPRASSWSDSGCTRSAPIPGASRI